MRLLAMYSYLLIGFYLGILVVFDAPVLLLSLPGIVGLLFGLLFIAIMGRYFVN